jgi:hypothetical protein
MCWENSLSLCSLCRAELWSYTPSSSGLSISRDPWDWGVNLHTWGHPLTWLSWWSFASANYIFAFGIHMIINIRFFYWLRVNILVLFPVVTTTSIYQITDLFAYLSTGPVPDIQGYLGSCQVAVSTCSFQKASVYAAIFPFSFSCWRSYSLVTFWKYVHTS